MTRPVTRLFDSHIEALAAVRQLEAAGIDHDHVSLIANNTERWHDGDDVGDEAAEGAAKGAATGGLIGGGAGLLAGLGMLAIPGLGPVVAAGWLVATLTGAAAGAVAGGATGGLLGSLKEAGHDDDEANVYAEGVRRGGSLVSVQPHSESEAALAKDILSSGFDAQQRGALYRASGWNQFDESSNPYSADEITAERSRYREARSFQDTGERFGDHEGGDDDLQTPRPIDPTLRSF